MGRARAGLLVGVLGLLANGAASGSEFAHIADDELAIEIDSRASDIQRTAARLALIDHQLVEEREAVAEARIELAEIERQLDNRVALLYRLSQHGKALRYLLSAASATGFLKRVATLRTLVITSLEERRRVGLALTEAEARMAALREEQSQAEALRARLEAAHQELVDEQLRRQGPAQISRR